MTQALQSSYVVPVLQIAAGVALLQIVSGEKNPLTEYAVKKISELSDQLFIAGKNVIHDFPVIAFGAGSTYAIAICAKKVGDESLGEDPLKVTLCIAGILALRSALSTYLKTVMADRGERADQDLNIRRTRHVVVLNALPIAIGCAAAYYAGIPVKLAQAARYTALLMLTMKVVGKYFESLFKDTHLKNRIEKMYADMR